MQSAYSVSKTTMPCLGEEAEQCLGNEYINLCAYGNA